MPAPLPPLKLQVLLRGGPWRPRLLRRRLPLLLLLLCRWLPLLHPLVHQNVTMVCRREG